VFGDHDPFGFQNVDGVLKGRTADVVDGDEVAFGGSLAPGASSPDLIFARRSLATCR
jgi:hypothetical protein